jgi:hypothetical protein
VLPAAPICVKKMAEPRHGMPRELDRNPGFREPGEFSNREPTNCNNQGMQSRSATERSARTTVVQAGFELACEAGLPSLLNMIRHGEKGFRAFDK